MLISSLIQLIRDSNRRIVIGDVLFYAGGNGSIPPGGKTLEQPRISLVGQRVSSPLRAIAGVEIDVGQLEGRARISEFEKALDDCTASLRYGSLPDAYRKQQELVKRLGRG